MLYVSTQISVMFCDTSVVQKVHNLELDKHNVQVKDAAKTYRVYFTKTDESKDYLVDHSIIMYLIDPKGNFVSFYGKNYTADQLATAISSQIEKWSA